jgi:hypothetical protein
MDEDNKVHSYFFSCIILSFWLQKIDTSVNVDDIRLGVNKYLAFDIVYIYFLVAS